MLSCLEIRRPPSLTSDGKKKRQMNSTPNPEPASPHDLALAALKEAYEQIGRHDGEFAWADEPVRQLKEHTAFHPSDRQKRPTVQSTQSSRKRLAMETLVGLLLAVCVCAAAFTWHAYGDAVVQIVTQWAPQRVSASWALLVKPGPPAQPNPRNVGELKADAGLPQPAPLAQNTPQGVPLKAAPIAPELAQLLQTIGRDIANLQQRIEQLKTSQEQMARENAKAMEQIKASQEQIARDNANAIEQLKASQEQVARQNASATEQLKAAQEQIARDNSKIGEQLKASEEQIARMLAKASEQNLRRKTSTAPPHQTATLTSKPAPALRPPQARAQSQAPRPEQH